MNNHSITIELPEHIFQQLTQIAETIKRPLAEIVAQSVVSNLPPKIDRAVPELQPELLRMQNLSDPELLSIAQSVVSPEQQHHHEQLLAKNASSALSDSEQQELAKLRSTLDQLTVYKAYAWALLRWRGHRLPALSEIPN
jgi:hypothetical protein